MSASASVSASVSASEPGRIRLFHLPGIPVCMGIRMDARIHAHIILMCHKGNAAHFLEYLYILKLYSLALVNYTSKKQWLKVTVETVHMLTAQS